MSALASLLSFLLICIHMPVILQLFSNVFQAKHRISLNPDTSLKPSGEQRTGYNLQLATFKCTPAELHAHGT